MRDFQFYISLTVKHAQNPLFQASNTDDLGRGKVTLYLYLTDDEKPFLATCVKPQGSSS